MLMLIQLQKLLGFFQWRGKNSWETYIDLQAAYIDISWPENPGDEKMGSAPHSGNKAGSKEEHEGWFLT